jgi:hypothetical protein
MRCHAQFSRWTNASRKTFDGAAMKRVLPGLAILLAGIALGFGMAMLFRPPPPLQITPQPAGTRVLTLTISATVDGSERFIFTRDSVYDEHGRWQAPKNVVFNGEPWPDLSSPPPGWEKLAVNLDLTKAAVVQRKGRDVIALERTTEGFDLYFADTQMGAAPYEATISIPIK